MSALRGGQIGEAEAALTELRGLNSQLLQSYSLLVVSRDGEQSGVWRVPERNPNARNYYLIVEAVGSDGKPLIMTITNEEDGSRVQTRKWGLRVSERVLPADCRRQERRRHHPGTPDRREAARLPESGIPGGDQRRCHYPMVTSGGPGLECGFLLCLKGEGVCRCEFIRTWPNEFGPTDSVFEIPASNIFAFIRS